MAARVWDRFLTETDRAYLTVARPKVPCRFGERVAVLSVNNYRAVVGDRPEPLFDGIKTWPDSIGLPAWEALDKIAVLLAAARAAGLPVIHVTGLAEEESGIPGWSARRHPHESCADPDAEERYRHRYDIVEQAAPLPHEVVLKKTAPSAFFGTPLLAHLMANRIDTLIICGEAVSGCVRATVVDGCSYRLRMIVVEECAYDRLEATRAMNLFDIDQMYGDVICLEETLAWIAKQTPVSEAAGHGHSPGHSHEDEGAVTTAIPARVLAQLPPGARAVSVILHPVHGHALRRSGGELVEAVRAEMTQAFGGSPHIIVELRDTEPGDPAELRTAVTQTSGGVVMIGVGYHPQAAAPVGASGPTHGAAARASLAPGATRAARSGEQLPVPDAAQKAPARAGECPECGAKGAVGERVTRSNGEVADLLVCAECGAAWEVDQ
ncbi:MAG: isochorismatase hydrolase [Actinomycetia bacterium]|nr:isochorismatase hydrolase [Actinomycetes bacterium]